MWQSQYNMTFANCCSLGLMNNCSVVTRQGIAECIVLIPHTWREQYSISYTFSL